MASHEKKLGANRSFLNEPFMTSLTSNISYKIILQRGWHNVLKEIEEEIYTQAQIDFAMSDCSRTISLDFDISSKEEMRNSLYKIDTIINVMTQMRKHVKEARLEVLKGQQKLKELKPKE